MIGAGASLLSMLADQFRRFTPESFQMTSSTATTGKKWLGRIARMAANVLRSLLPPLVNFVAAYLVISSTSEARWGEVVNDLVIVGLTSSLLAWGNKEYVLRAFSREPSQVAAIWQGSFLARLPLLLAGIASLLLWYDPAEMLWPAVWLTALFLYQSLDVVVVYTRRFLSAILVELIVLVLLVLALDQWVVGLTHMEIVYCFALAAVLRAGLLFAFHARSLLKKGKAQTKDFLKLAFPFLLIGLSGLLQSKTDLYIVNIRLDDAETGVYQVVINGLLYGQAFAGLVLSPYAKNLYRLPAARLRRLALVFAGAGIPIALGGAAVMIFLINYFYDFWVEL